MNLNDFAKEVVLKEGGKINLSIAQVKEVMRIVFTRLSMASPAEVEKILKKYKKYR